jgi:hypothetical protein
MTAVEILDMTEDGNVSDTNIPDDKELSENIPCFQPITRFGTDKLTWEDEITVPLEQDDTAVQVGQLSIKHYVKGK